MDGSGALVACERGALLLSMPGREPLLIAEMSGIAG
jgi:hypothetical protein